MSLSSLNRARSGNERTPAIAEAADVLRKHFAKIFPEAEIEVCNAMCEKKNEEMVLGVWKNSSKERKKCRHRTWSIASITATRKWIC